MGVILVSLSDSEAKQTAGLLSHPTTQQALVDSRATLGDLLALVSALFYAMYVILLKVRIKSESRIDMQLFFGFVGLFNILVCWPIGIILHLTGVEIFEWPSSRKIVSAILINVCAIFTPDMSSHLSRFRWQSLYRATIYMSSPCSRPPLLWLQLV